MPLNEREQILAGQRDRAEAECERLRKEAEQAKAALVHGQRSTRVFAQENFAMGDAINAQAVREHELKREIERLTVVNESLADQVARMKGAWDILGHTPLERDKWAKANQAAMQRGDYKEINRLLREENAELYKRIYRMEEIIRVVEANNRGRCDYCGCAPHVDCALEAVVRKPEGD